jgi:hypothetical protein
VVPSKIHACIESGKRILFIGSQDSDIDRLTSEALPAGQYRRVDVGDVDALVDALWALETALLSETKPNGKWKEGWPSGKRACALDSFAPQSTRP